MNTRLKLLIAFGSSLLVVLSLWQADRYTAARFVSLFSWEPKHNGIKFSYWMNHLQWERAGFNPDAEAAIRAMGTNTLPYLVEWIQRPNRSRGSSYSDPLKATIAFQLLGDEATPAIPDLIKIVGQPDQNRRPGSPWNYPARALVNMGKNAAPSLANKLMELLSKTNKQVLAGSNALAAGDAREGYDYAGIFGVLTRMGTNAEAALPALVAVASSDLPAGVVDYMALAVVGRRHPDIVAPILVKKFVSNSDERGGIAQAMAVFGSSQADAFVLPIVTTLANQFPTNRWDLAEIGQSLANIGRNSPNVVLPTLMRIYTNSDLAARSYLAESFIIFKDQARSIVPLLMADSWRENSTNFNGWRINLCLAAKKIAPDMSNTLAPLYRDLELNNEMLRNDTVRDLAKLGADGAEAIPILLKPSNYDDNETYNTIRAIGVASDEVIMELGDNLASTNAQTAARALQALGVLAERYQPAFTMLVKKVRDPGISYAFRKTLTDKLWKLHYEERTYRHHRVSTASFENCFEDTDADVRLGALTLMKGDEKGNCAFEAPKSKVKQMATNDPDPKVREYVKELLFKNSYLFSY